MKCEICPHLKAITAALKPCQTCEAGRLNRTVSADASDAAARLYSHALPIPSGSATGVTNLSPEAENAVRVALATVFDFAPLQLLLLQHVLHGGSFASFNEPVRELVEKIKRKGYNLDDGQTSFRAVVSLWSKKMIAKMPTLKRFFDEAISENSSTHKRTFVKNPVEQFYAAHGLEKPRAIVRFS